MSLALLFVAAGSLLQAASQPAQALALALHTAGISAAPAPNARVETLRVHDFAEASWRSSSDGWTFAVLPGATPYFSGDVQHSGTETLAWSEAVAAPTWDGQELVLRLVQQGDTALARGRLRLPPPRSSSARAASEMQRLTQVSSGCPMTQEFELPLSFGAEALELDFSWDLHSPVPLERRRLKFRGAAGALPDAAIELVEDHPLLQVTPRRLLLGADASEEVLVSVPSAREGRLERVVHSACVQLVSVERLGAGWKLVFRDRGWGDSLHVCGAIRVDVVLAGDPQPFQRYIGVRHTGALRDERGVRVVWDVFAPGEHVELWTNGSRLQSVHPDRLPCTAELLGSFGYSRGAAFDVPAEPGLVDLLLQSSTGPVRIQGLAAPMQRALEEWGECCAK